ncbi:RING-type E3 ubiquitin transferase [Malassezia cuniculi]|uniref:RING-type E3 ubiquitin transferase n=1 Tax=Malassezia cuniculi TaxID=948313 RepID=A0AAF0ERP0_9BASI|nr:RING-type E3 ubiquitin transferase [Malassezia cuniculi]
MTNGGEEFVYVSDDEDDGVIIVVSDDDADEIEELAFVSAPPRRSSATSSLDATATATSTATPIPTSSTTTAPTATPTSISTGTTPATAVTTPNAQQKAPTLTAEEIRRQKVQAAREAMQRAKTTRARVTPKDTLLSTYACPICLSPPKNICVTPCGHVFCGQCIYDALESQNKGSEWTEFDWLGAMGAPTQHSSYGSTPFTPFGSSAAMALATAAGVDAAPARQAFNQLVTQRRTANTALSANRLRAANGSARLRGHCPVCRSAINGGFTGPARKGIMGLEIKVGTPATDAEAEAETRAAENAGAPARPRKRRHS